MYYNINTRARAAAAAADGCKNMAEEGSNRNCRNQVVKMNELR
jgi:hypothetical protein